MTTPSGRLEHMARTDPDRVLIIDHGRPVTASRLYRIAVRLGTWLRRQGLAPGDVVGLTVRDGLRHLATSYALMQSGCAHVPLASHEPALMRAAMAGRCGVRCVIGEGPQARLDGVALIVPDFEAIFDDGALDDAVAGARPDETAVILTSSGATGRPKLVACTERQLFAYGQTEIVDAPAFFMHYSIESNSAKWIGLANLAHGLTIVFEDAERVSLPEICIKHGVGRLHLYPAKLESFCRAATDHTEAERAVLARTHIVTGGTRVVGPVRHEVTRLLTPRLHVMYGATECGVVATASPDSHADWPDAVGYPAPGVQVRVVDDRGQDLPPGEVGLIRIRSAWSASAYLDDEEATARMFRDGWFQPGDLARRAADGRLTVIGRGDDMMILNSINVFPEEIEMIAMGYPGVLECAAFARRGTAWGDIPMLAVVGGPDLDTRALLAWCRERLGTRAPRGALRVEAIPRNAVGKVLRRELEASDPGQD